MKTATALEIIATLGIAWTMVLAGVKKRVLTFRGQRTCVVCKQPLRRCRCH